MTMNWDDTNLEATLQAYLDRTLDDAARQDFECLLNEHDELRQRVQLQQQMDAALLRLFPLPGISEHDPAASLARSNAPRSIHASPPQEQQHDTLVTDRAGRAKVGRRRLFWAVAAVLAWMAVFWHFFGRKADAPYFEQRSLALLYHESVDSGFEPYYDCHEPGRFASTFQQRQGRPLRLAEMPDGTRMLGLSYPGGFTRNTTAILCEVDQQPVIVFVDRLTDDNRRLSSCKEAGLHIFRQELNGLVLYEVSPWPNRRVLDFLQLADVQGRPLP